MSIPKIPDYPMPFAESFPPNRTKWQIEPARAVLLIHDMQVYFLRFYAPDSPLIETLVQNLVRLKQWAHQHQIPVVYTAQPHMQSARDRALLNDMWGPGLTAADPESQQIVAALSPGQDDTVLSKWRYSAFQRTDLSERMREWGRDQLVIGGIYAHIGCMVTAVDAFMRDIQAFMIGDAVADFSETEHKMALEYVATRCGQILDTHTLTGAGNGQVFR